MSIPKLKRIKVSSEQQIRNWLAKNASQTGPVMLVTCNRISRTKHVARDAVQRALPDHGWTEGRAYTLKGNLDGRVIRRL